jgi:SWI/SNF-related matrix-associated actin-dependent regulator 1 of chromatin subfamily A
MVGAENILVVCPASCRPNWLREFTQFSPFDRPAVAIETAKQAIPSQGVVVVSYDLATSKAAELKAKTWDLLILDEAHYLKERRAKRTKALYGKGAKTPGVIGSAKKTWCLSGTPAPNDASELWPHLFFLGGVQDGYWDFVFRYCAGFNSDFGYRITGTKNIEELKQRMRPVMLRRLKTEVMDQLPPLTFQLVEVEPSEVNPEEFLGHKDFSQVQQEVTNAEKILAKALASVQDPSGGRVDGRTQVLAGMSQCMATLRRYTAMQKLPAILDIIEDELRRDRKRKIVLFAIHKTVIAATRERLAPYGAAVVYGATGPQQRQAAIEEFMENPECRVFIGNIHAAGTGIDGLQKASCEVAFLEQDWVPASNAQAVMRVHRNLQTYPVRVRIFFLRNSSDELVQKALSRKIRELTKFI